MRVQLKWSQSRQMWVGQTVARPKASKLLAGIMRWLQPEQTNTRRVLTSRVWHSTRHL
ncbi:MAG: hypothetical protein JHC38_03275 [Thiotrichales bacterium]|jgi:hypothetical protein|nr:hypothetical protein [Thiotrichales bacterium]